MENVNPMGVIFDLDGVLVDSYRTHFESWQSLAQEYGTTMTETQFASLFGRTSPDIINELWGDHLSPDQVPAMAERKEALYREILDRDFPAMDGARELIDQLVQKNFLLGVGSSGPPRNVELSLEKLGRRKQFSAVITGKDVTRGKPDPQVFLIAAQRMELEASRCAVIEDAPAGISAARAVGMAAIALTGTVSADKLNHADLVVKSLRELTPEKIARLIRTK
jgi:beta-phosphoglucomutase family hydrolase